MHKHPREGESGRAASSYQTRPFLKWPGGKSRIAGHLLSLLPQGSRLIEPFVGAGALFSRSVYRSYVLSDINGDLENLYTFLRDTPTELINACAALFDPELEPEARYYERRERFNRLGYTLERAALFVFLNRFGFNGLCRYNRAGMFNVPAGRFGRTPALPEEVMRTWSRKLQTATLLTGDFARAMCEARSGDVVFCDPPYASDEKCFTEYSGRRFRWDDHCRLTEFARALADRGIPVLITNHDVPAVRTLYEGAQIWSLMVQRSIGAAATSRAKVGEIAALFA